MITDIKRLLSALNLRGMAEKLDILLSESEKNGLSTIETLLHLLQEEFRDQQERSMKSRILKAKIPNNWTIDTFPFDRKPSINKLQIQNLTNLAFIERHENIVLIGEPGTGKTSIASGLLRHALINGYRGLFFDAQKLLEQLYSSLADKTTTRLITTLSNISVLLIDELGYLTLTNEQCNAFFKLMSMRYENKKSTIITTNLDYPKWYDLFKQKSLVDAMLDRLKHHCITIHIEGPSLRDSSEEKDKNKNSKARKSSEKHKVQV
jgi:DNA replication protein DnaC